MAKLNGKGMMDGERAYGPDAASTSRVQARSRTELWTRVYTSAFVIVYTFFKVADASSFDLE